MSSYTIELILMTTMFIVMIGVLIHVMFLIHRDSKAYREALQKYLEESVEDGKRKARDKEL